GHGAGGRSRCWWQVTGARGWQVMVERWVRLVGTWAGDRSGQYRSGYERGELVLEQGVEPCASGVGVGACHASAGDLGQDCEVEVQAVERQSATHGLVGDERLAGLSGVTA